MSVVVQPFKPVKPITIASVISVFSTYRNRIVLFFCYLSLLLVIFCSIGLSDLVLFQPVPINPGYGISLTDKEQRNQSLFLSIVLDVCILEIAAVLAYSLSGPKAQSSSI